MKAKVLRKFRDKETKEIHAKGKEIEVTPKRFKEINNGSYGKLLKEIKEEKKESSVTKKTSTAKK